MMRPLLGQVVLPTAISDINIHSPSLQLSPNPATEEVQLEFGSYGEADYTVTELSGRVLLKGFTTSGSKINITNLTPGMYIINLSQQGEKWPPQKVIKL